MSIQKIIQEAINKNPHDLKEALEEELRDRIRLALEAKMSDEEDDDSSEEDDDSSEEDDEEDDDEEDMKKESVEQIDELDRKTLASYVKKASADQYLKGQAVQYHTNKANDGPKSFERATRAKHTDAADKALRKASNRDTGIGRAVDRLAKESVDQIDEISASTLGSYIRKGTKDIEKSYDAREKARDVEDSKTARAMGLRARKREKGVSDAISKLTGHYTAKVHAGDK